jgi:hypothetical protein
VACLAYVGEELRHQLAFIEASEIRNLLENVKRNRLCAVRLVTRKKPLALWGTEAIFSNALYNNLS